MKQTLSITRKELSSYFGSPMALIFVGVFLAATLFAFFWVDTFFSRGIADVRPLFRWMPILMIFLVAALTMRQWSEEQRSGTLEVLLTLPISKIQLVLGKFLAVLALIALALALTVFLPITVSILGNLDWGPVIGGYLAALLMAAAYTAIGLFVSSRTDNQIVSLILTVLACGLLYGVGAQGVTALVGGGFGDILRSIGAGSRFESIERGVVDLRDLVYYLSLTGVFLALNALSLDKKRWSTGATTASYRRGLTFTTLLVIVNLLAVNVWMFPLTSLRLDLTAQHEYSLSQTTKDLLANLNEPLLIRGYISQKTHPLLAPVIPDIADMLAEYEIAGGGRVTAEVVDPIKNPDMEVEANQTYGIQPSPLQISGRYESSVINAYFDILVRYGDQNVVLNFRDLLEFEPHRDGAVDVRLRNLEYDLTRSIKKVVYGFQSVDAVLAAMTEPAKLTLFVTPDTLPAGLEEAPVAIEQVAQDLRDSSGGKFSYEVIDPDAPGSPVNRQTLLETFRLQPISASLFSDQTYYLDMVLSVGERAQILYAGGDLSEANIRTAIESALKRVSTGFLKVVGIWTPPEEPTQNMFGQMQPALRTWNGVRQQLSQDYTLKTVDLSTGEVPSDVDVLLVISPEGLDDKALFAVDQHLMRGGAVMIASGRYALSLDQFAGNLALQPVEGDLQALLTHYGIQVDPALVMDPQNEPFPVQVDRKVGGMTVREIQAINYPFFVDVRADAMDRTSPLVANLSAVTINWASPITVDEAKNQDREVSVLLQSSTDAWLSTDPNIQPDLDTYPEVGFPTGTERAAHPVAVAVRGSFRSYFQDKPSPLLASAPVTGTETADTTAQAAPLTGSLIEQSPDSARLILVSSNDFLTDIVFQISSSLTPDRYRSSLQLLQNSVDWSVEDLDLLSIRSRGAQSRVLQPMTERQQMFWEGLNYALALLALVAIGMTWSLRQRNEKPMALEKAGKPTA